MTLAAESRLDQLLAGEDLEGVFFLHGDAARLRDEAARRLMEAAVDPATRDFNRDMFRGGDVEPSELASALSTPPMMSDRRVVAVFEAQKLTARGRKVVESVLDDPPPGLALVVVARIPDRSRASFYDELRRKARVLEWEIPGPDELPGWLVQRAESRYGYVLEPRAAGAMAAAVGRDPGVLDAELEKLASAAREGRVSREEVRRLVPNVKPVDRWEWLDRVASRDYGPARRDLPMLLSASSESAVGLLVGMVDQHLYVGVALQGGRRAVSDALTAAGKPYLKWKARIYAGQARHWTAGELDRALGLMRRADRQAKSGVRDRRVLEELLLSLEILRKEAA